MSNKLIGAAVIGQSGGPTAVINSSVYGVIHTALNAPEITAVYGMANGIQGMLDGKLYDMGQEDEEELRLLMNTPSSELGSCRYKLTKPEKDSSDFETLLEIFKKYNIRYFFYNGGNDSMDTCNKVSRFMASSGWDCRVIGVPKTIDNDLYKTDHCPGFGSAAKYIATSCAELYKDTHAYAIGTITIVEIMGRNAGWLTAASALASTIGCGPDLIYLPEVNFSMEKFFADIDEVLSRQKNCFIAVSEGVHYADGTLVSEAKTSGADGFGHAQLGGLAARLADAVKKRGHSKVRGIELSLLQRCAAHGASQTDIDEAFLAGKTAVEAAIAGESGYMVGFERVYKDGEYVCKTLLSPLADVANFEKKIPLEWINEAHNGVTGEFIDYARPLIRGEVTRAVTKDGMPRFAQLKKILVK